MIPSSQGGATALKRESGWYMRKFRYGMDIFASPKFPTRGVLEPVDAANRKNSGMGTARTRGRLGLLTPGHGMGMAGQINDAARWVRYRGWTCRTDHPIDMTESDRWC
jgi:hypothetical protein